MIQESWRIQLKDLKIVPKETFEYDVRLHQLMTDEEILATLIEVQSPSEDRDDEKDFSDEEKVEKWLY